MNTPEEIQEEIELLKRRSRRQGVTKQKKEALIMAIQIWITYCVDELD